jgi:hypothetical protein
MRRPERPTASRNRLRRDQRQCLTTKSVAAGDGAADQIDKAKRLLGSAAITPAEFDAVKARAVA